MTEKTIYIADDGTEFEEMAECEAYEKDKKMQNIYIFDYCRMTDSPLHAEHFDNEELTLNRNINLYECSCIYIKDRDALDFFIDEGESAEGLNINTLSFFDVENSQWYSIDDLINTYESALTTLKKMKENFEINFLPAIK